MGILGEAGFLLTNSRSAAVGRLQYPECLCQEDYDPLVEQGEVPSLCVPHVKRHLVFLQKEEKVFFLFLNVHCFWNWMETNTEREGGKGGTDKHTTCFCQAVCTLKPIFF